MYHEDEEPVGEPVDLLVAETSKLDVEGDSENFPISYGSGLGAIALAQETEPTEQHSYAIGDLAEKWEMTIDALHILTRSFKIAHPELVIEKDTRSNTRLYSSEQVKIMEQEFRIIPPTDTYSIQDLAIRWDIDVSSARNRVRDFRQAHPEIEVSRWRHKRGESSGIRITAEELVILEAERPKKAIDGYKNATDLSVRWKVSRATAGARLKDFYGAHPEQEVVKFQVLTIRENPIIHISPENLELLESEQEISLEEPPTGSRTSLELADDWQLQPDTLQQATLRLRKQYPNDVYYYDVGSKRSNRQSVKYTVSQQEIIIKDLGLDRKQRAENLEGLKTIQEVATEWGVSVQSVYKWARRIEREYPDQVVKRYIPFEGSTREAIYLDENQILIIEQMRQSNDYVLAQEKVGLKERLSGTLNDIDSQDIATQEFRLLLTLFGAETAIDILYQQHPEYKRLPVPYVKSKLADYLGDFLLIKGGFSLDGLEKGMPFLAHPSFRDSLTEVIKNDCLRLLNNLSKTAPDEVNETAVTQYIVHIREQAAEFSNPDLEEILSEIEAYYGLLFENIHKPDYFVDKLDDGRFFPDINQRINVQEIAFKNKVLIADEMGTGKSASVIMAKEIIRAKQALIVVPSNVIPVWQGYLSDEVNGDGKQVGYFKEGRAPRVLTVTSLEDLTTVTPGDYDYVIISQERLNESYTNALGAFDYDMLIVDEMHKLKNISSGKRSDNLLKLAERIEGKDKYLALLSGTPVPNKVGDIAITLKLLYPERFGDSSNKQLVSQIINGDMLDLRGLLVPRMQMKGLSGNIDMPELHETTQSVELSEREKEIYEILIEEDELTASEKLAILRQFSLNPRMLDATPDLVGSKVTRVGQALASTFQEKDRVVMFINGYIENVMRGSDTIFDDLTLPEGVELATIDGTVSKERRLEIQRQLQEAGKKMLLVVSGQTADTGVDFSAAEEVYHYNEPWSVYDKQQQTARVYRPGLKDDLTVQTFISEGTIERGIHEYIGSKYSAVEKLLRGVPISEIEKNMLRQEEKRADSSVEVNPELAKYYFSAADKMAKIYGHVKELGEDNFRKFLATYDKEYANSYADLVGSRSYQANVSRLSGSLIKQMVEAKNQQPSDVRVLDLASGPEMLRRHIADDLADSVISLDINQEHFKNAEGKTVVGSFVHSLVADKSVDYVNLSLGLHYTSFVPSKGNFERLEALKEANRVLRVGGRMTIGMIHSLTLTEDSVFEETMGKLGLKVIREYTGLASAGKNFQTQVITLEKVSDAPEIGALVRDISAQGLKSLKFKKTDTSLVDSRKIVKKFLLGDSTIDVNFNAVDKEVLDEEEHVIAQMEDLKANFDGVENIPKSEIVTHGFSRIFNGKRYVLFKRLTTDVGAVAIR